MNSHRQHAVYAAFAAVTILAVGCRTARETVPVESPATEAAAVDQTVGTRPADAVAFGGHWYKVFIEAGSWHEKKARCEAMGGYLACIETEEEQRFIAGLADNQYLSLGATDEGEEDTWVWVNGAVFDYACWMGGQPNNWGECEHFLATYDGGDWVDVAADGDDFWMPTGFICEWEE
jgi:hypothetical protein